MKKLLSLFLAVCVCSVSAGIINFDFLGGQMDGAEENPDVVTAATGFSTGITYDDVTRLLTVNATFSDLSSLANNAHVHGPAVVGINAGVVFGLSFDAATSGTISGSGTLSVAQETDLFNQLLYVNLHSVNNGNGEIRGQLVPVPEPGEYALIAGIGALAFTVWRRLQRRRGSVSA